MRSLISVVRASFAAALLMLAPALHAQHRTAATRAIRGKLVIAGDQGTMFTIGAGGSARYRAHLAVASRVLEILKRDAGLVAPIGYDMHLWRIAGPNDSPLSRYFPSHSGINGVLLDYQDDARAVATNSVDISDEGLGFTVLVNDPSCAIGSEIILDEQGPITTAVPRGHAYQEYPSYGDDGLCILVTTIARPLTVPVSQERWLRAQIRRRRAVLDSVHQQDRAYAPEALDSSAAAASQQAAADYGEWLAEAPGREAQRNSMLEMMRRTMTPAQIEEMRQRFKSSDSLQVATYKRLMASASDSQAQAFRHALSTGVQAVDVDTTALHDVHLLEAELARMSPVARCRRPLESVATRNRVPGGAFVKCDGSLGRRDDPPGERRRRHATHRGTAARQSALLSRRGAGHARPPAGGDGQLECRSRAGQSVHRRTEP